jgi:hypothetical protein
MSGLGLWNSDKEQDKVEITWDKAERSDMSGLETGHVRLELLETSLGAEYVWPDRRFWW